MPASSPADYGPDRPWETCVVPLVVFLATGIFEPTPTGTGLAGQLGIPYAAYPLIYTLRVAATAVAIALAWRPIRTWVGRTTWWPIPLGFVLAVPWIVLAMLQRMNAELGKTIIMVTHDAHAAGAAQSLVHLEKGELIDGHAG